MQGLQAISFLVIGDSEAEECQPAVPHFNWSIVRLVLKFADWRAQHLQTFANLYPGPECVKYEGDRRTGEAYMG